MAGEQTKLYYSEVHFYGRLLFENVWNVDIITSMVSIILYFIQKTYYAINNSGDCP